MADTRHPDEAKAKVRVQFGDNAAAYATSAPHAHGASLPRLVELARPQADWRVLDVATGAGHTALAFAPYVAEVVATDLTPEMLAVAAGLARDRGLANVTFAPADAEDLPFGDGAFDLVTCRIAAHHFPDVGRFLAEAARVLRPGGVLGLVDNVVPDDPVAAAFVNAFEARRDPSHVRCLPLAAWAGALADAGFAVTHAESAAKAILFATWIANMAVPAETAALLREMLASAPPPAAAFLRPTETEDGLVFHLAEGLVIGRKAGPQPHV